MIRDVIFADEVATTEKQPEVVRFLIKNPLRQKTHVTLLLENELAVRKEIHAWFTGWLKRLLPPQVLRLAESKRRRDVYQAMDWMQSHGIRLDNPGNRSLERHVYNQGKIVGIFRIEIQDTL